MRNSFHEKTFLLTGAHGSIGSQLQKMLSNKFSLIALERNKSNRYLLKNIKDRTFKQVILLHFGAQTPANNNHGANHFTENLTQFENLLDDVKKISENVDVINASSMSVYDTSNELIVTENTKKTKTCAYGLSKLKIEDKIQELSNIGKIRNYASLRLPGVLSINSAEASGNFLSTAISKISRGENLEIFNKDKLFNNLVSCDNIAKLIELLVDKEDFRYQYINIGAILNTTLGEILQYAKDKLKSQSNIIDLGNKASFTIDIHKLIGIGFEPSIAFDSVEYYIRVNRLNT